MQSPTNTILEHPFRNVKYPVNSQLPLFPEAMIHHNRRGTYNNKIVLLPGKRPPLPYGVSRDRRVLSPQTLLKRFDQVRDCLAGPLGQGTAQREVTLRLLRLWAYYGQVYPKESMVTADPGCSKATFWRTVRDLKDRGLVRVVNRYFIRPHAQTSNLYIFTRLLIIIARYLAEHGVSFRQRWLQPYLRMTGTMFWPWILRAPDSS